MTTEQYFDGYQDALEAVLEGVDAGEDFESTINFMEIELARIARARREAGFSHRVYEDGPKTYVLKGGVYAGLTLGSIIPIQSIRVGDSVYADRGDIDRNGYVILENCFVLGLSKLGKTDPLGGDGMALH